jgi:hypothetical protein
MVPNERASDYADDDAKYRAAIAEPGDNADDALGHEEPDGDAPVEVESEAGDTGAPLVLPFGQWRGKRADMAQSAPTEPTVTSGPEPAEKTEDREPTVFKLSVPDIASPNIPAPAAAAGTVTARSGPGKEDAGPSTAKPDADVQPTQAATDKPEVEEAARDDQSARESDRVKKDDRPFFFDDPMV